MSPLDLLSRFFDYGDHVIGLVTVQLLPPELATHAENIHQIRKGNVDVARLEQTKLKIEHITLYYQIRSIASLFFVSFIMSFLGALRGGLTSRVLQSVIGRYLAYSLVLYSMRKNFVLVKWASIMTILIGLFTIFNDIQNTTSMPPILRQFTNISLFPVVAYYMIRGNEALAVTGISVIMYVYNFWVSLDESFQLHIREDEVISVFVAGIVVHVYPIWIFFMFESEKKVFLALLKKFLEASEDKNKEKTVFISRMSHELRTPLHGLLSSANLLRQTLISEEQDAYLSTIDSCGEVILDVVFKILEITRIESGNFESREISFSLFELLRNISESIASLAEDKNIKILLDYDLESTGFDVKGDKTHLREVLLNLLGNAIKYTPSGYIMLHVKKLVGSSSDTPIFRFEIEDTGLGIPEADLERIFTPFTQVHRNLRKSEGSGLGLSIAKKIVEALSGQIGVTSQVGVGSTFWIELPLENLPPSTLYPPLGKDSFQTAESIRTLASFFGCRDVQSVTPPPDPFVIGICSTGRSLDLFSHYLGFWGVSAVIINTEAEVESFIAAGNTHLLIDNDLELLSVLFRNLSKFGGEEAHRVVLFSPLSTWSAFRKAVVAGQHLAKTGVVTKPIGPLKVAMAILFLLGYDVRFNAGRTGDLSAPSVQTASFSSALGSSATRRLGVLQEGINTTSSTDQLASVPVPAPEPVTIPATTPVESPQQNQIEVLVVEDNFVNQMIMKKQLEKLRVQFAVTPSAEEGVRIWNSLKEPVPIILMDVEVEGALNGLQATSRIRELEKQRAKERNKKGLAPHQRSYIAVMTGRAMEEDKQEALACGCDEFLTKPVSLNLIRDLVRTHLNHQLE